MRQEIKAAKVTVVDAAFELPRGRMTAQDRALIEIWMLDVERRMLALSMRCQERVQR